jgi:hypothetical protein
MKMRVLFLLICWLLANLIATTKAFGQFYTYVPQSTTNLVTNPSFETGTSGWTASGSGSIARAIGVGDQKFGAYSLSVSPGSGGTDGVYFGTVSLTSGQTYTFSVYINSGGAALNLQIWFGSTGGAQLGTPTTFTTTAGVWERHVVTYTETSSTSRRLYITKVSGAALTSWEIDGAQLENLPYETSYCDGDQSGCRWTGTSHGSTSQRTVLTRSGGKKVDLQTYNAYLVSQQGTGMPPVKNISHPYASADGSSYDKTVALERPFTLAFSMSGDGVQNWHQRRAALIDVIKPNATTIYMPMVIGYSDGGSDCEIGAVYDGGLEMENGTRDIETIPIRFIAHDPYWYRVGEKATSLTPQLSVGNANSIIQRSSSGLWSAVSTGASGGDTVRTIAQGPDGSIYAGGAFTAMSGVANTPGIAKWNGSVWSALGTGTSVGGDVHSIVFGPDGTLYAGGAFTSMGGVANTAYIAKWNGSAWSALGTGANTVVNTLAIGPDGTLYAGGVFTSMGGVANTAHIAKWNGSAWSAMGTGIAGGDVNALAIGLDRILYVGGAFTSAGGVANTADIAKWNGSAWSSMGTNINNTVHSLAVGKNGLLYIGGVFTIAGGSVADYIAIWNGSTIGKWSTGANGAVYYISSNSDGSLSLSGGFTSIGGLTVPYAAVWNGSTFVYPDAALPGTLIYVAFTAQDGTTYYGYTTNGTATTEATTSVTTTASGDCFPTITISGPSSGTSRVYSITNFTTNEYIYLNTTINAGEAITITLAPGRKSIISSFRGNIYNDILPGSNFGSFHLAPGVANVIGFYAASSSVSAQIRWRERLLSVDNGTP